MGEAVRGLIMVLALSCSATVAAADPPSTFRDPVTGMELVNVPGGTFSMGCNLEWNDRCFDNEKPAHEVTLSAFRIGRSEVTQEQWRKVMGEDPADLSAKDCGGDCPVDSVAWDDVQEFIKKLNSMGEHKYRLPTEAEWEYACRSGGKEEIYSGANTADTVAWYNDNSKRELHPVGKRSANGFAVSDMSGNVWEWVQDIYGAYAAAAATDPVVESGGSDRIFRGGYFGSVSRHLRCTMRNRGSSSMKVNAIGFRLAMTP
ncbi:formylglycine-generating enzyme family protein [Candidatus Magnetaquicoccus inordinatus]|uniref:formylglycine-generating enzyme family protein n=1 Tax=Candidatus Magnetaquicoccus inordinatus TaxID=2496818 RepID=UPI00102AB958|nr:formylglycine-generating enzyme family protein [Candidatus Magnetaquicoccus inordinatus]